MWPKTLDALDPPWLVLGDGNMHKAAAARSNIRGSPKLASKPELLLTKLEESIGGLVPMYLDPETDDLKLVQNSNPIADAAEYLHDCAFSTGCQLLVGTTGSGKTRVLYKLMWTKKWVNYFTGSKRGNGGSIDMRLLISWAERLLSSPQVGVEESREQIEFATAMLVCFRTSVLVAALEKFPDMLPRHWAMMQLYPAEAFGLDVFSEFAQQLGSMEIKPPCEPRMQSLLWNVLDEAQAIDAIFPDRFPSRRIPGQFRSLLSPVAAGLASVFPERIIMAGTGLNARKAYDVAVSLSKDVGRTQVVALAGYFDHSQVRSMLGWAGLSLDESCSNVLGLTQAVADRIVGRARHWASMAEACLHIGCTPEAHLPIWTQVWSEMYRGMANVLRFKSIVGQKVLSMADEGLFAYVRNACAMPYVLGGSGRVDAKHLVDLLNVGVCALRSTGQGAEFVVAEPAVIRVFADAPKKVFEYMHTATATHSSVGYQLEDYIAICAGDVLEYLKLVFAGEEAAIEYRGKWMMGTERGDARLAVRAQLASAEEVGYLEQVLDRKVACAVFPGTSCGADVILSFWEEGTERVLVVLVQSRAGTAATTVAALDVLRYPYCQKRKEWRQARSNYEKEKAGSGAAAESLAKRAKSSPSEVLGNLDSPPPDAARRDAEAKLRALVTRPSTYVVRLAFKPMAGSSEADRTPRVVDAPNVVPALEIVVDKTNKRELRGMFPGLEELKDFKDHA